MITCGSAASMPDCNHEEADIRMVVLLRHALLLEGAVTALVRTVDTDVVVILVGKLHDLKAVNAHVNIWVTFGMGRNFKLISINRICASLGEQKSRSLPLFHAFTGCDTTSAFNGKGKRSAWKAWALCNNAVTPSLEFLSTHPFQQLQDDSTHFRSLERLVIIMYDKSSPWILSMRPEWICSVNTTELSKISLLPR